MLKEDKEKLDIRANENEFDLHISSKKESFLVCQRSKDKSVSFINFLQIK